MLQNLHRFVSTFKGVHIEKSGDFSTITLKEREVPQLAPKEVLVKVHFSTINPSDINTASGRYPVGVPPIFLGLEGAGTVVKTGSDALSSALLNKNVAFVSKGTWAEYCVVNSEFAFPLDPSIPVNQAASMIVNPMTAAMFAGIIRESPSKAALHNPAASALGKMLVKICKAENLKLVNLVRRTEQVEILEKIGAENIFNTAVDGWKDKAKERINELKVSMGLDAIAGPGVADLSDILPNGAVIYNYGSLSGKNCEISGSALRFRRQEIRGLWVTAWLSELTYENRIKAFNFVQKHFWDAFATEYAETVGLSGVRDAVVRYSTNAATNQKILIETKFS